MDKGSKWHRFLSRRKGEGLSIDEISRMYQEEKNDDNPTKIRKEKDNDQKGFSKKKLREYEEVRTWLRTVSESAKKNYLLALKKFCNWCGVNSECITIILQYSTRQKNRRTDRRTHI